MVVRGDGDGDGGRAVLALARSRPSFDPPGGVYRLQRMATGHRPCGRARQHFGLVAMGMAGCSKRFGRMKALHHIAFAFKFIDCGRRVRSMVMEEVVVVQVSY